jgi:endogenous inhibitor of DNA gyrase (YacG/DUF329 family)
MVERENNNIGETSKERKKILCKICGKEFKNYKSFSRHLRVHKITSKRYYDKFLKEEGEGICPICGKETSYINLRKGYRKFCSSECANEGKYFSEETRRKISDANKGKHPSEETKRKLSDANKGKHRSEETKKKLSDANKGKNNPMYGKHHTEETKKKISDANKGENNPNYGKHPSEETRKKMSEAHKGENNYNYGKHPSEETRKKMSDANKGKHCPSKETRKKLSDANKGENNPNYGKHLSEETRKKLSEALRGENNPNYGKHLSEETKKKISEANKGKLAGKNNPSYKGGISLKEFKDAYGLEPVEWKRLAQQIRKRDNFTCQLCGKKGATDVHHIIPRRVKIDNSPGNLITLCRSCHRKIEYLTDKYLAEGKDPREIFYKKWDD